MKPGEIVKILECHKLPDLVGKLAKVLSVADPELVAYPILVILPEPVTITMETPLGTATMQLVGPFPFREDELELAKPDAGIPKDFLDAFEKDKPEGGDQAQAK